MPIEEIVIPDATTHPAEYKQALLDLIGDRDPLDVIAETVAKVRAICVDASDEALVSAPTPGEWSAHQVVSHMFDVDIIYGFRWRLVLTWDNPTYPGYDEKLWTPLPHQAFWPMVDAWEGLRAANVNLIGSTARANWQRTGVHDEQGPETFDEMVRKVAAHDLAHLNQIERAIEALQTSEEPASAAALATA